MFYGLGDKATQMNLKGKRLENFATDHAFQKDQEPLYKVVPFILGYKQAMVFSSTIHLEPLILS
jgi:alpha-glucosidase